MILCIGFSCVKDEDKSGYNCVNNKCTATFENPTYLTLQDCQAACSSSTTNPPSTVKNGTASLHVIWNHMCAATQFYFTVTVGLGYTSTDVANNAFFTSKKLTVPGVDWNISDLKPAIYYYKATKSAGSEHCPPTTVTIKSGSFTIESGKTTSITVNLN